MWFLSDYVIHNPAGKTNLTCYVDKKNIFVPPGWHCNNSSVLAHSRTGRTRCLSARLAKREKIMAKIKLCSTKTEKCI
jgi:hypothetical protein